MSEQGLDGFCTCDGGYVLINQTCGVRRHREAAREALRGSLVSRGGDQRE